MEFPHPNWREADAAQPQWDVDRLAAAMKAAEAFGSIAAMVVREGVVVAGSGRRKEKVVVRSIRKSFLSALIGIAVHEGKIGLDASMADLGIDDVDALTSQEKEATVRDLLKACSGIYHAALAASAEMIASRPARGSAAPGSQWNYNNWDFNALGTIYERATGQSIYKAFDERIAKPIGMESYHPDDGFYLRGAQSWHPAYHFRMTVEDMARFGQLYLNDGRWNDDQVVPAEWVRESTTPHSRTPPEGGGYGYMWWTYGGERKDVRTSSDHPARPTFRYSAEGADGQLIRVVPEKQLVMVLLSESKERNKEDWDNYRVFVNGALRAFPSVRESPNPAPAT